MVILHNRATQPPTTSRLAVGKKYTRKSTDTLTPWRNGLLPGYTMGNILNQHAEHLEHQRPTADSRSEPAPNCPSTSLPKTTTPEKAPAPSPLGFMKPFPSPQTPAPCTTTYATLQHDRTHQLAPTCYTFCLRTSPELSCPTHLAPRSHPITTFVAAAAASEGWDQTIAAAMNAWGHIDVLVNTVGDAKRVPLVPTPDSGPDIKTMTDDQWRVLTESNVNAIAPGSFPDEDLSTEAQLDASRKRAEATVPLGRYGNIREIGLLALYLAPNASNLMTGETLHLDRGFTHP